MHIEKETINPKSDSLQNKPFTFIDTIEKKALWLTLAVVAIMALVVFRDFISYKNVFLFTDIGSDTVKQYFPYTYLQIDYFHKHGMPGWSFQIGMGDSTMTFALYDFFNILFYFFDADKLVYLLFIKEFVKLLFIGYIFYKYLELINVSKTVALTGTILICFCSYTITGLCWIIFSYEVFCLVYFLFAIEKAIQRSYYYHISLAVFFICVSQPLYLWVFGLFLLPYTILRFIWLKQTFFSKQTGKFYLLFFLFGLAGLLLSAPFLFENISALISSHRGSTPGYFTENINAPIKHDTLFYVNPSLYLASAFLRTLSIDILGNPLTYRGFMNYPEAPMYYCGLVCLLLIPQLFYFLKGKIKFVFAVFLAIWLLPNIFPYLRFLIWLLKGDYFRAYSLLVTITLIIYSVLSLDYIIRYKKISINILTGTLIGILFLTALSLYPFDKNIIDIHILIGVIILLLFYALCLILFHKRENKKIYLWLIITGTVLELLYMSDTVANKRQAVSMIDFKDKLGYNDYTIDAVTYLKKKDSAFYRIDKDYFSSFSPYGGENDPMAQGFYSTSCYSSFNNANWANYLIETETIGNEEWQTRLIDGLCRKQRPVLESLNSVKYCLTKDYFYPAYKRVFFDSIAKIGDVFILKNKNYLPFGYLYSTISKKETFLKLNTSQKDLFLIKSCYLNESDFSRFMNVKPFELQDTIPLSEYTPEGIKPHINNLKKDTLSLVLFSETKIKGDINASANGLLYLALPVSKGWQAIIDGEKQDFIKINGGMSGLYLNKGQHTIELKYELPYFKKGLIVSCVGLILFVFLNVLQRRTK